MKRLELPLPDWTPSLEFIATTNIAWLMQRAGVDSYEALHAWSVGHREAYWALAIERLGLRFCEPFHRVVDLSHGVEAPRWLPGARLNIVESCFAAPAESPAILHQTEGGKLKVMSYGELEALADRVAANLHRRGYRPGDALAILMPMTAEAVAIYLGIIKAGCVVVGIADSFQPKEIATRLLLSSAVAIFTQDVLRRGGKALPLYANAIEAGAPPAIVLPAQDHISLPLRTGDCAWHDFLESPLFPTDLRTGHEPSERVRALQQAASSAAELLAGKMPAAHRGSRKSMSGLKRCRASRQTRSTSFSRPAPPALRQRSRGRRRLRSSAPRTHTFIKTCNPPTCSSGRRTSAG
jgi:acetyl-CoA synthetase